MALKLKTGFGNTPLPYWIILFCIQVVGAGFYFSDLPIAGDEHVYLRYSSSILQGDFSEIYGRGFMPGMGFVTAIPRLFYSNINLGLFMAVFNLVLAGLIARCSPFETKSKSLFFIFLTLSPMTIYFSYRIWGDLVAGYLLLFIGLLFLKAYRSRWNLVLLAVVGASCAVILYFRHNLILLGPFIFLSLIWLQLRSPASFKSRIWPFAKQGLALIIGFFGLWTPWIVASSMKHDRVILHPNMIEPYKQSTIWAMTPPDGKWTHRQTPEWGRFLFVKAESILIREGFLSEDEKWKGITKFDGRDFSDVRVQGEKLGYSKFRYPKGTMPRKVWPQAIKTAVKEIQIDVRQNTKMSDRIAAWFRNFGNIYGSPNQFLANGLASKGVEFENSSGLFSTRMTYARTQNRVVAYQWPTKPVFGFILIFNGLIYLFVLISAVLFLCSRQHSETEKAFRLFAWGAVLSFTFIIFVHPGHGRYIFQLMPILIFCSALFWARRLLSSA